MNSLCAVIAAWRNASQRSRVGVGMNRSARGLSVKRFERSNKLDSALYKKRSSYGPPNVLDLTTTTLLQISKFLPYELPMIL